MRRIKISAYELAQRFIGTKEISGQLDNPLVLAMLQLDQKWPEHDEVPWCSAFVNFVTWELRLPRSKDLRARSWLEIGEPIEAMRAEPGADVVVIKRGVGEQPGPEVINAPGHVGFYAGYEHGRILILGGNQSNSINIAPFPTSDLLGVRRLY